jgi:hypothetical protein
MKNCLKSGVNYTLCGEGDQLFWLLNFEEFDKYFIFVKYCINLAGSVV